MLLIEVLVCTFQSHILLDKPLIFVPLLAKGSFGLFGILLRMHLGM